MAGLFDFLRPKQKYLADTEYWVFVPGEAMPTQDALMDFVIKGDPESGVPGAIGPQEGILFSDIRLGISLILKSRNPHLFRPDLIGEFVDVTKAQLESLAAANAIVKIRYLSEEPLSDERHLRLLPHLATAAGSLGRADLIYDVQAEILWDRSRLWDALKGGQSAARPEIHVRALWKPLASGGQAETRGLAKVGLRDFATKGMNADEQVLVTSVVEEAARELFRRRSMPETLEVESFGDKFRIMFGTKSKGLAQATILRMR